MVQAPDFFNFDSYQAIPTTEDPWVSGHYGQRNDGLLAQSQACLPAFCIALLKPHSGIISCDWYC